MSWTKESGSFDVGLPLSQSQYLQSVPKWRRYTAAMGDELAAAIGDSDSLSARFLALEALVNYAPFGLQAGMPATFLEAPDANWLEVLGTEVNTFAKTDYPSLYKAFAPYLTSWTALVSGTNEDINDAVFNDGRYILAGSQKGLYALAGTTTLQSASVNPNGVVKSLAANGLTGASALVVGVGSADYVGTTSGLTSGDTWSTQSSGQADANVNWSEVIYCAGNINKFVCIGFKKTASSPDTYESYIRSSADGVTWALEKTLAGRWQSIAYNDHYASSNEFVIVGWPLLGDSVAAARKASTLNGTWGALTFDSEVTPSVYLNSVAYYDDGTARGFAVCGLAGKAGVKEIGATNISAATDVPGLPTLNKVVADAENQVFYALGQPVNGVAYIYEASPAQAGVLWVPESVGAFALNGYAVDSTNQRFVVGNGGKVFAFTGQTASTFTIPYPYGSIAPSPYRAFVLTESVSADLGAEEVVDVDLTKLESGWQLVKLLDTSTDYVRGFAQHGDTMVAYGDGGLLYKSVDGYNWIDISGVLTITGDITSAVFSSSGYLGVTTPTGYSVLNPALDTVTKLGTGALDYLTVFIDDDENIIFAKKAFGYNTVTGRITYLNVLSPTYNTNTGDSYEWLDNNGYPGVTDTDNPVNYKNYVYQGQLFLPYVSGGNSYLLKEWQANYFDIAAQINDFVVKNLSHSNVWGELMLCGKDGKAFVVSEDATGTPQQITISQQYDIEDAVHFAAKAWVMATRRGLYVSTDSQNVTYYPGAISATRIMAVNKPGEFKLLANSMAYPGYVSLCVF